MKITLEIMKGLNVASYIKWLISEAKNIEIATISLPYLHNNQNRLLVDSYKWYSYELQKMTIDNLQPSKWYQKYKELAENRINRLETTIKEHENSLENAILLASPKDVKKASENEVKKPAKGWRDLSFKCAETINFNELNVLSKSKELLFKTSVEYDLDEFKKKFRWNTNAVNVEFEKVKDIEFMFLDNVLESRFCRDFFYNDKAVFELAQLEYLHQLATWDTPLQNKVIEPIKTLDKTQFTELCKALLEMGVLKYETEKQAIESLSIAFNIDIDKAEFDRKLQKIKARNIHTETLFLDTLKNALSNWMKK